MTNRVRISSSLLLFCLFALEACLRRRINATPFNASSSHPKCRILGFFPTSPISGEYLDGAEDRWWGREYELQRVSRDYMVAASLAVEHFNQRNPAVVPELATLPPKCTAQLELKSITEALDPESGVSLLLQEAPTTCAMLGTYNTMVARAMQPVSVATRVPQVIYATMDPFLTNKQRQSAVGTLAGTLPRVTALAEYLNAGQVIPPRVYMTLIYEEAYTSSYTAQCFQEDAAEKFGLVSQKWQDDHLGVIPKTTVEEMQKKILGIVKTGGVRTIWLNKLRSDSLNYTAQVLAQYEMLTDDFLYILTPQAVPLDSVGRIFGELPVDSPLDRLLRGAIVLDIMDPYRIDGDKDDFLRKWREAANSTEDVPADYASFLYDGIIRVGMGACAAMTNASMGNFTFRDQINSTSFTGATGPMYSCSPGSGSRCSDPLKLGIYNIRAVPASEGKHGYESVLTSVWDDDNRWQKVNEFVYRDGTTTPPTTLRVAQEKYYLSASTRGFGYFLYSSAVFASLIALAGLYVVRADAVIMRAQPFFLVLLCIGSLITSTSILTLSFDEESGVSQAGLNAACMLTLWFFFVGHTLCFATLFTRMWRVDFVTQFRRRSLTTGRATLPIFVILVATVLILMIWTIVDPWTWERTWISEVPAESYGKCQCANFWAFFGPLMGILVLSEVLTLVFAWKTSHIDKDFRDTEVSFYAILMQVQAWVVGVPILAVLGTSSADAVYLSRALLIWIFSLSNVLIVVGSKLHYAYQVRRNPELDRRRSKAVRVTGIVHSVDATGLVHSIDGLRTASSSKMDSIQASHRVSNLSSIGTESNAPDMP